MKKYIVTTSLNIDNILSTESISPISAYDYRKFGYNHFYEIGIRMPSNYIVLFSAIPHFEIVDDLRENYPMVIQIDDDVQLKGCYKIGNYKEVDIYGYNSTILLTPDNCKLLFFTPNTKMLTRQNSLDSKLNKWGEYFLFETVTPSCISLIEIINHVSWPDKLNNNNSLDENLHDRAKGFIYGYYLGLSKSISPQVAQMLAIQKRIYDIVASVKNNNGQSNSAFNQELIRLDEEYERKDPDRKKLNDLWKRKSNECDIPVSNLNRWLKDNGMLDLAKEQFCKRYDINIRKRFTAYTPWQLEEYSNDTKIYTNRLIEVEKTKEITLNELDVTPDLSQVMLDKTDETNMLFNHVIATLLWSNVIGTKENLRLNRADIATNVTKGIINIFKQTKKDWENSKERIFFHHLRQNLLEFTPFNLKEIDNIIWQSLAAFILKGDDLDDLVNYLSTQSIPSYQYALALWGATCGYVQLSKGILATSLTKTERESLYKKTYRLLYNREYEGELMNAVWKNSQSLEHEVVSPTKTYSLTVQVKSIINFDITKEEQEIIDNALLNAGNDREKFIISIGKSLNKRKKLFQKLKKELDSEYNTNIKVIKKKTVRETIKNTSKGLFNDEQEQNSAHNPYIGGNTFLSGRNTLKRSNSIIEDEYAGDYIEDFSDMPINLRTEVVTLFKEFQKKYQPGGYYFKDTQKYKRNNSDVIDHFVKWCLSSMNPNAIQRSNDNSALMNKLKYKLLGIYHD